MMQGGPPSFQGMARPPPPNLVPPPGEFMGRQCERDWQQVLSLPSNRGLIYYMSSGGTSASHHTADLTQGLEWLGRRILVAGPQALELTDRLPLAAESSCKSEGPPPQIKLTLHRCLVRS